MSRVEEVLKSKGPMLSGELIKQLMSQYDISYDSARKEISRARSPVEKIKTLPFRRNQVFVVLQDQLTTSRYRTNLYKALKAESKCLSCMLTALESSYGIMNKSLLPVYSSSPVKNTKGHRLFSRNIKYLIDAGIVSEREDYYELSQFYSNVEVNLNKSMGQEIVCKIIVKDFLSWAQNLNLIAYNTTTIYPKKNLFAQFDWFATGPSYVYPVFSESKPGFMVVDALFKNNVDIADVEFFIDKVSIIRNFKRVRPFAPVFLARSLTENALTYLKKNHIMVFVLSNLFDKKYTDTITDIYNSLINSTAIIRNNPDKLLKLFKTLSKNQGRYTNVMGAFFECMVGLFFVRQNISYIEVRKEIPNVNAPPYEMDVFCSKDNTLYVIECKAQTRELEKEYVEKWLLTRVPRFKEWINETYKDSHNIKIEIWSLSGFSREAKDLLNKHICNGYDLSYRDKRGIYKLAKEKKDDVFMKQIEEYYYDYGVHL